MRAKVAIAAATLAVLASAASGTAAGTAAAAAAEGPGRVACGAWGGAGLPYSGTLMSVVAFSGCDAWAAGDQGSHSLVVHWTGHRWALVRSGVVKWDSGGQAVAIGGTSDRDIWLASVDARARLVVEHWNGVRFSRVSVPLPAGAKGATLSGISAVSRTDAWAAGWYEPGGGASSVTLLEHWNGRAWSIVPSADPSTPSQFGPGTSNFLYGVSARRGSGAWAAGNYFNGATDGMSTLIEHWNGHSWVWVKSPDAARFNQLEAVSVDSRSDAWAVGFKNGLPDKALVEHWNGSVWQVVAFPDPGRDGKDRPASVLTGVSALSPDDVWVCGVYPVKGGQERTLLAHWNGTAWRQVATPASVKITNVLSGIAAPAPDAIWSVGGTITVNGVRQALALYHR